MITEIVVGILVLWTLYSEIQRYQITKLTVDTLEGMDRSISSMKRVFSGKLLEQQKYVDDGFDELELDVKEALETGRGQAMWLRDLQHEVDGVHTSISFITRRGDES